MIFTSDWATPAASSAASRLKCEVEANGVATVLPLRSAIVLIPGLATSASADADDVEDPRHPVLDPAGDATRRRAAADQPDVHGVGQHGLVDVAAGGEQAPLDVDVRTERGLQPLLVLDDEIAVGDLLVGDADLLRQLGRVAELGAVDAPVPGVVAVPAAAARGRRRRCVAATAVVGGARRRDLLSLPQAAREASGDTEIASSRVRT